MEGQGGECPRPGCGGALLPRRGKWGLFWGCSNWSANGCPETRRARTLGKGHAFVVLEAEAVDAFRLYLRAFPVPAMKFVHFVGCFFNLFFKPESIFQAKSYHDRLI